MEEVFLHLFPWTRRDCDTNIYKCCMQIELIMIMKECTQTYKYVNKVHIYLMKYDTGEFFSVLWLISSNPFEDRSTWRGPGIIIGSFRKLSFLLKAHCLQNCISNYKVKF